MYLIFKCLLKRRANQPGQSNQRFINCDHLFDDPFHMTLSLFFIFEVFFASLLPFLFMQVNLVLFFQIWLLLSFSFSSYVTQKLKSEALPQGQHPTTWIQQVQDSVKDKSYVLDIDLDFFSTANPFRNLLEPEAEEALKRLYHYTTPTEFSDEARGYRIIEKILYFIFVWL